MMLRGTPILISIIETAIELGTLGNMSVGYIKIAIEFFTEREEYEKCVPLRDELQWREKQCIIVREPGYYWVIFFEGSKWQPAQYMGDYKWVLAGIDQCTHETELYKVNEIRILNPNEW